MRKFIIHGPGKFAARTVEAATLSDARRVAMILALRAGYSGEELRDCSAEPYCFDRAYDLDLLPYQGLPQWSERSIDGEWSWT